MGVALSQAITTAIPSVSETGVIIGAIAGFLSEMTTPGVAVIMVLALMPLKLLPIGIVGGRRVIERFVPRVALKPGR